MTRQYGVGNHRLVKVEHEIARPQAIIALVEREINLNTKGRAGKTSIGKGEIKGARLLPKERTEEAKRKKVEKYMFHF